VSAAGGPCIATRRRLAWRVTFGLSLLLAPASEAAASTDVPLFTITKSENRNFIQYAVGVDSQCIPTPGTPVHAYWRMIERGPTVTAPLLAREIKAYGLASQQLVPPVTPGAAGAVRIVLTAVPDRPVLVETSRATDGTCSALSTTRIASASAHLASVYVRLKWPFGIDYLLLRGWSMDGAHSVEEKLGT
jgi:hypothetical protein